MSFLLPSLDNKMILDFLGAMLRRTYDEGLWIQPLFLLQLETEHDFWQTPSWKLLLLVSILIEGKE